MNHHILCVIHHYQLLQITVVVDRDWEVEMRIIMKSNLVCTLYIQISLIVIDNNKEWIKDNIMKIVEDQHCIHRMNLYQVVVIQLVVIIDRGVTFQEVEGVTNLFHYILYQVIHCKIDLVGVDGILEMNQFILYILVIPGVDMINLLIHRHTIMKNLEHPCIPFIPTAIYKHHKEEVEEKSAVGGVTMMKIILIQHHLLLSNHLFTQTTHYCTIRYKGIREEVQQIII